MTNPRERRIDPSQFQVRAVERPVLLAKVEEIVTPLRKLAGDLAEISDRHPVVTRATFEIHGDPTMAGKVIFEKPRNSLGNVEVHVEGNLGRDTTPIPKGTPYATQSSGEVCFQPTKDRPRYAKSGDTVQKGQRLLWMMESKATQYAIVAPETGKITYVVEDGTKVQTDHKGVNNSGNEVNVPATILFYIEPLENK